MKTIKFKDTILIVAACLGLGLAQAGAALMTNTSKAVVYCDGSGLLCDQVHEVTVLTTGTLLAQFTAAATHCASVYFHFAVDGQEVAILGPIAPGQATPSLDLGPVAPGSHSIQIRAEGYLNNCISNVLWSWGGDLQVVTSVPCGGFVSLALERSGSHWVLSWPASGSNWVVESSTTLPNVGSWRPEAASPTLIEGRLWLTNSLSGPARFFRLHSECPL